MSIYKQFKTNDEKESNGVWVAYSENANFLLARSCARNKKYQAALDRALKPHQKAIRLGTLGEKKRESIYKNCFAEHILLGWKGSDMVNADGEKLVYSVENAKQLLTDLPDLYDRLFLDAADAELFKDTDLEDKAKN